MALIVWFLIRPLAPLIVALFGAMLLGQAFGIPVASMILEYLVDLVSWVFAMLVDWLVDLVAERLNPFS